MAAKCHIRPPKVSEVPQSLNYVKMRIVRSSEQNMAAMFEALSHVGNFGSSTHKSNPCQPKSATISTKPALKEPSLLGHNQPLLPQAKGFKLEPWLTRTIIFMFMTSVQGPDVKHAIANTKLCHLVCLVPFLSLFIKVNLRYIPRIIVVRATTRP